MQQKPSTKKDSKHSSIFIKKIKKLKHAGHHGGAWKVAYADFVSAMMALFIVLWILSSSEKVKQAIALYFQNPGVFDYAKETTTSSGDLTPRETKEQTNPNVKQTRNDNNSKEIRKVSSKSIPIIKSPKVSDEFRKLEYIPEKNNQETKKNSSAPISNVDLGKTKEEEKRKREISEMSGHIESSIEKNELSEVAEVIQGRNGLRVRIKGFVLFEPGKAELKKEMNSFLDAIVEGMNMFKYNLLVEGHTDNAPIINVSIYPSNWELSSARASSVIRYLIDKGISPKRLYAIGYADQYPIESNVNDENRAKNRRVEFVFTNKPMRIGTEET